MPVSRKAASVDEPLTERRFCELFNLQLQTVLNEKLTDIMAPFVAKIQQLESKCEKLETMCDKLQCAQTALLQSQEKLEITSRCKNVIITDLKEELNTNAAIKEIIHIIMAASQDSPTAPLNFDCKRLGSNQSHPRPVKVVFQTEEASSKVKRNAKLLRQHNQFNNVYINPDWPPATSKENARLRNRAKQIRATNPNSTVQIRKGKLLIDDAIVDSFNIANQTDNSSAENQ